MAAIPVWLQVILSVFSIIEPQFAWLAPVIEAAYELIMLLPFFKRPAAIMHLRKAVQVAKTMKDIAPIVSLNATLKAKVDAFNAH